MTEFFQDGPLLTNTYLQDSFIQSYVERFFPDEMRTEVQEELTRLGKRMATDVWDMAVRAENNGPELIQFDPWGKRIDHIEVNPAWNDLDKVAAEEGIVATGYERKYGKYSRSFQFLKLYLFHASSSYYSCPLAMTDGAAKLIELSDDQKLKSRAFKHLTSRDPKLFWTSGQWMTERSGGSDVGRSETIARKEDGEWKLYGIKWFTSATTSQMAMTLARVEEDGKVIEGSRGLSLFYLELRDQENNLNGIEIMRLKDKLGTKALPTAELKLKGTKAKLVGNIGEGVKTIASLFNVTRIYNSCCATSAMRRILTLSKDYAGKREAFGKKLSQHPLHVQTLADIEVETQAATHLTFFVAELLGREELGEATSEDSQLLRLLTPIAKLYTAKENLKATSELLESFGGAGYIEDTGLPKWLRDAQVLTIWEGTTNVLSLDVLRALSKECPLEVYIKAVKEKLEKLNSHELAPSKDKILESLGQLEGLIAKIGKQGQDFAQGMARDFSLSLGRVISAALMLEHAQFCFEKKPIYTAIAKRFCQKDLFQGFMPDEEFRRESQDIFSL